MTIDPRQLLRRLEPAVRPAGAASSAPRRASVADGAFEELFELAREGGVESGRMPLAQVARALEEKLGRYRQKLGEVRGAVRIEQGWLATIDRAAELCVTGRKRGVRCRITAGAAGFEKVRDLMDHHVVAVVPGLRVLHIAP